MLRKILNNQKGFAIIDAMIATKLGLFLILASVAMLIGLMAISLKIGQYSSFNQKNIIISKFLKKSLAIPGGNSLATGRSVIVDDNETDSCKAKKWFPACNGHDRVTVVHAVFDSVKQEFPPPIAVSNYESGNGTVSIFTDDAVPCSVDESKFLNRHIVLLDIESKYYYFRYVVGVDKVLCKLVTESDGQGEMLNSHTIDKLDSANFAGGVVLPVHLNTFYVDDERHQLISFSKSNPVLSNNAEDLLPDDIVERVDGVYDFQVLLNRNVGGEATSIEIQVASGDPSFQNDNYSGVLMNGPLMEFTGVHLKTMMNRFFFR